MNTRWSFLLAAGTIVLCGGALLATAAAPGTGQDQSPMQASAGNVRISTLIGMTVLNAQRQEKVGQIKDVLLDSRTGQVTFVVLDAEIPALGHAMLVVPYQALQVSVNPADQRQSLSLDLRPDRMRVAPQIQNDQWQALQNPQFLDKARAFYGPQGAYTVARPIGEASSPPTLSAMPPPCQPSADSGWTRNLDDFYNE